MKKRKQPRVYIVEGRAPYLTGKDTDYQRAVTTDKSEARIAAVFYNAAGYIVKVSAQTLGRTSILGIHYSTYEDFFAKELTESCRFAV